MTVKLILNKREFEVKHGMTLRDALIKINVLPDSVLTEKNGVLITDDEILNNGDVIKLISVFSGRSGIDLS